MNYFSNLDGTIWTLAFSPVHLQEVQTIFWILADCKEQKWPAKKIGLLRVGDSTRGGNIDWDLTKSVEHVFDILFSVFENPLCADLVFLQRT